MFYFEHYLSSAGLRSLERAVILRTTDEEWVYDDLRSEILDVFPAAQVAVAAPGGLPERCDLIVLPLMAPSGFPFHDVVYDSLHQLELLVPLRDRAAYFMVYRARWREVEVVPARRLTALLRKRWLEGVVIRACRRSSLLRRLLRPHYPG